MTTIAKGLLHMMIAIVPAMQFTMPGSAIRIEVAIGATEAIAVKATTTIMAAGVIGTIVATSNRHAIVIERPAARGADDMAA